MQHAPRIRFDWFVLKPLWLVFLALALFYGFQQAWLLASAMVLLAFSLGMVGAALHPGKTFSDLAAGYPHRQGVLDTLRPATLELDTSQALGRAAISVAARVGLAVIIIASHSGMRLLFAVPLGFFVGWLSLLPVAFLAAAPIPFFKKEGIEE